MLQKITQFFRRSTRQKYSPIDPDEIFLDSKNLPDFNVHQFEGRLEKPISSQVFGGVALCMLLIASIFTWKIWHLQIVDGETYTQRSQNNSLHMTRIFADRGLIVDRNNIPLAWNELNTGTTTDFSLRAYATSTGFSTTLGYIKYPSKDSSGFYYQDTFDPKDGLEKIYNDVLHGSTGRKIEEVDVKGNIISESVIEPPQSGENVVLSIDSRVQKRLYESMLDIAGRAGYKGGAGVIMDVTTGEILASANFPEYESGVLTDGTDRDKINTWIKSKNNPFMNRVVDGLYTPGSIVKPFVAMGVLDQGVIDPRTQILSTGSISVPNPYAPDKPSIFMDWKAHGLVDLRRALAVSSNVYFYEVTGGYKGQKGIGIYNIEKYVRMFGFGTTTGINFPGEKKGIIPDPEWKSATFDGEPWRLGDTYNTAIGQYGFQVTPIQVVRSVSAIANGGTLLVPTFIKGSPTTVSGKVSLSPSYYTIVKEGMRLGVTEGTSQPLHVPFVEVAAKTGTAQLGVTKDEVNSWVVGFWPYEHPRYAFAIVMERGSKNNQFSSTLVMKGLLDWMGVYAPEYLK